MIFICLILAYFALFVIAAPFPEHNVARLRHHRFARYLNTTTTSCSSTTVSSVMQSQASQTQDTQSSKENPTSKPELSIIPMNPATFVSTIAPITFYDTSGNAIITARPSPVTSIGYVPVSLLSSQAVSSIPSYVPATVSEVVESTTSVTSSSAPAVYTSPSSPAIYTTAKDTKTTSFPTYRFSNTSTPIFSTTVLSSALTSLVTSVSSSTAYSSLYGPYSRVFSYALPSPNTTSIQYATASPLSSSVLYSTSTTTSIPVQTYNFGYTQTIGLQSTGTTSPDTSSTMLGEVSTSPSATPSVYYSTAVVSTIYTTVTMIYSTTSSPSSLIPQYTASALPTSSPSPSLTSYQPAMVSSPIYSSTTTTDLGPYSMAYTFVYPSSSSIFSYSSVTPIPYTYQPSTLANESPSPMTSCAATQISSEAPYQLSTVASALEVTTISSGSGITIVPIAPEAIYTVTDTVTVTERVPYTVFATVTATIGADAY